MAQPEETQVGVSPNLPSVTNEDSDKALPTVPNLLVTDGDNVIDENEDEEEQFIYPVPSATQSETAQASATRKSHPSPAQLESLYAATSSGDLPLLKRLFRKALETGDVEPFSLANDASSRTGFTALHAAASRGYLDIVVWLIEECGAMPDMEDREGETALHKAALNGHISIVVYLLPNKADVHARDADGWTALHNACSKGYLDIVRWLCEQGNATSTVDDTPGVDVRSKDGWTPLMNAASKGHLPVVLYLLTKQSANPLVRNKWGETAFDAAAAVFEIWICEILQQAEADRWRSAANPYNPLLVHTTVPLILYENQRLDTRLKTVAVSGGRPRFSAFGLGKHGRSPPFALKLLTPDKDAGKQYVAAWRSGVQLPLREAPWTVPKPQMNNEPVLENVERSHFWLSDWTLDITHPGVDGEEGWQYTNHFSDPEEWWTAEKPHQLERILNGNSIVPAGFGGSSSLSSSGPARSPAKWVRRRRWVRIMRRRLDIPPLPFLEPDGVLYYLDADGFIPYREGENPVGNGNSWELSLSPATTPLTAQDYVSRARYLVGNHFQENEPDNEILSPVETRRAITNLESAIMELRQGLLGDENADRKTQAEVLLNTYSRELDRRKQSADARGLIVSADDDGLEVDDEPSDEEFRYPVARPTSSRSSVSTDYLTSQGSVRTPNDLTPQLSQAPDFRVPTHEAPQKIATPRWSSPTPHQLQAQWERDESVQQCRDCQRRFNFINRRHCRKCGCIFCDRCTSQRVLLDPSDIVRDPSLPTTPPSNTSQRVCHSCYDELNATVPSRLLGGNGTVMERIVVDQERLTIPGHYPRRQSSSQLSDLADCPVCNQNLSEVGSVSEQESHVKNCLDGGSGASSQTAKYLVYQLPAGSTLLGVECVICLEEFAKGSSVARLSCFCSFHSACLSSWLQRGKNCPVHAR